ncbi:right-handed parallel beta-helix repeat-containing protein [Aureivirga sp. CE67]|uniref:right-handed parallel beta-helix repeat-containing protein n=1 Tax=Aureivirga sp. CE67 TaxID=1788983 RepID=UPI0018C8E1E5|nr:hypothetical protein [Aureivirga sp. CE67]
MKQIFAFLAIISLLFLGSCRKDFETVQNNSRLGFSKDTVYLDTVFTNIGSSTYNLKVYNNSSEDIFIPSIRLGRGENSNYRINVDGIPGKSFENIEILAKDSIFVFIETTIDYNAVTDPIYTDSLIFDSQAFQQDVKLVTLVQDAHFLYPSKNAEGMIETIPIGTDADGEEISIQGFYLDQNATWNDEKPYVVYGYAAVPEGGNLTVEEGAKIHFHANSGLMVSNQASVHMNGTLENQIMIEGDRLEPALSDVAGQWGAIWLREGSQDNQINHTVIKNATIGLLIDSNGNGVDPNLTIKNTQIYNNTNYGILAREANILGENLVINNSGNASLAATIGGTYNFKQCTFANYWRSGLRQFPAVLVNNYYTVVENGIETKIAKDLYEANFTNCIISGSSNIELIVDRVEETLFGYNFKNNLIQFNDVGGNYAEIPEYNFSDLEHYQDNIFNEKPMFKDPYENELVIGQDSPVVDKADQQTAQQVPFDILGVDRTANPDIGAYQHQLLDDSEE